MAARSTPWAPGQTFVNPAAPEVERVHLDVECLCGKVRGVIDGVLGPHRVCHCVDCKRMTGGTHREYFIARDDDLSISSGAHHIDSFRFLGKAAIATNSHLSRCRRCGSPLWKHDGENEPLRLEVFVGALRDPTWLDDHSPDFEFHDGDRCARLPRLANLPALPSTSLMAGTPTPANLLIESDRAASEQEEQQHGSSADKSRSVRASSGCHPQ
ncbi:Mss4-like protein [Durotheca rogersii]|uniref:Mss4-like protein n=1 Tax=Durotheca rogersii TaxID=419775 RepID=UPI00221F2E69|nr:Mss4-like protein [Durotheca rogersii]KAI5864177.1 Mss4-like protein [Durotheca rogersii]